MSKSTKISTLKPFLKQSVDNIIVSNAAAYGGQDHAQSSISAALASAVMLKAQQFKQGNLRNGVSAQDWLQMGRDLYTKVSAPNAKPVNAVCDTCSALVIYIINSIINFNGRFELFAETTIHHHYVVVDRDPNSDPADYSTWGDNAFVIDIWQAKFSGRETTNRGLFSWTAHHYKHGIYRNPEEHVYTRNRRGNYRYKAEHAWAK